VDRENPVRDPGSEEEIQEVEGEEIEGLGAEAKSLVLVVEDNPDMRGFIRDCLGREFKIRTSVNGEDGLEKARKLRPDMIVSDIMMPKMNGYELCAELKKEPELRHIPFLLLSSKSEVSMKVEGFEQGADDYMTKPFSPRELVARVHNLLKLRSLENEVLERNKELEEALTNLQEAQVQLIHSEKMASLGVLSAGLVHEINNPLNAASSSIRTLLRSLERYRNGEMVAEEMNQKIERGANRIHQGLKRCEEIVTGLLTFSRKNYEGRKYADIHEGIESTLNLVALDPGQKVTFHRDFRFTGRVFCDMGQLNQVFMNLLTNACQAIEKEGDIWIRTEKNGEEAVMITVEDSGSGIPEDVLVRIFEPFYTTKDVGKGTGLGLSISHKIIQQHNGRIEVESKPGQGSSFRVILPLESKVV
jgi:signal transduction histidine kinase